MAFAHQTQVKGYQIRDLIASGGFGEVYLARQESINRDVAIKIILPEHANKPDFIRRFEVEAQLVARLEHPHITPLYDYWRDPEGAYLVMRYLRGGNLRDLIDKSPIELEVIIKVIDQISSALYIAHRNNVIHRDIKPENILLDEDGNAYLTDFGIAKDLERPAEEHLTQTKTVIGSLDYLAPEQAHGQPVSGRTDTYSLGVVIWEALVGEHPYEALSSIERLYKFINEPLPLIEKFDEEINERINQVIQKATEKNPDNRYPDVVAFADAFREAAGIKESRMELEAAELLTAREQEVLHCLVQRKSNKEISEELVIELTTVKWYVRQIFKKLNVRSRVQAAARAKELNLVADRQPHHLVTTTSLYGLPELENPYKGLNAFTAADEQDFFGREKLILHLLKQMNAKEEFSRFLAIVGPSGSGKSSLVKAGLVPALWRGGLPDSEKWFIVDMVPGTDAIDELEIALTRIVPQQGLNIGEYLRRDKKGLLTASKLILPEDDSELVLIIDQFEELFTLTEDEDIRNHFLDLIHTAVTDKRSRVRVVITMRADFYDRPLHYPAIAEMIRSRVETVLPLTAEELERAIVNPARRVGMELEEGLLARMINDVLYQPGALPLMQYALTELYESRHDRLLPLSGYESMGGVVGALANRAEQIYQEMDKDTQAATHQIFLRLVTLGDDGKNTRRRASQSELIEMFSDTDMVEEILDTFTAYRLISMDNDPETRQPIVEVAHEAILVEWGRLRDWLTESQMDIRIHRQLERATRDWRNADEDTSYLLRGTRLQQFINWRQETNLALTSTENKFLECSAAARDERRAEELAQQERERALEQRSRRMLRWLVGIMSLAAVVAIGLSIYAFGQQKEAVQNFSMSLAAHVQNALDNKENDLALALALAASEIDNPPPIVARMLRQAAYEPGPIAQIDIEETFGMDQMPWAMGVSPTEFISLIGFHDGTLILWDVMEAREIRRFEGHTDVVSDVVFSSDGTKALSVSYDTTAIVWDVKTGEILTRFEGHNGWLRGAAFSPDGKTVATGGFVGTEAENITNPGELIIWDPQTGEEISRLDGHPSAVEDLEFSHDGTKLLASSGMFSSISNLSSLYYWDLSSEEIIVDIPLETDAYDLEISPDGSTAAYVSIAAIEIIDLETGSTISTISDVSAMPRSLNWAPLGDMLATIDSDGKLQVWSYPTLTPIAQAHIHLHQSGSWSESFYAGTRVSLSPDGRYAVSVADDNQLMIWDLKYAGEIRSFYGHQDFIGGISITPDGQYILSGSGSYCFCGAPGQDNIVRFWNAQTGELIHELEGHTDLVTYTDMTPDGKRGITASVDSSARVWDLEKGELLWAFEDIHPGVWSAVISPDGKTALTTGISDTDASLKYWNLETGELIRVIEHPNKADSATKLMFTRDGLTAYGGMDDLTKIDLTSGDTTVYPQEKSLCCVGFAMSSDYKTCFGLENADGTLRSWDIESGKIIHEFGFHGGNRSRVEISADDQVLMSSAVFGELYLWDPDTGEMIRSWTIGGINLDIDMTADGKLAVTQGPNNSLVLHNIDLPIAVGDVQDWIAENRVVRELTCEERLKYSIEPFCESE